MYFLKNYKKINKKGFTLLEILISLGIFSIIVVGFGLIQRDVFSLNSFLTGSIKNQEELKKIIDPMINEIRGASISELGGYPLEEVSDYSFVFYSDIDDDGESERIRYFLDDGTFKKGIIEPSGSPVQYDIDDEKIIRVVHDVISTEPIFTYFDTTYDGSSSSTPLSQPVVSSDVRLVRVKITSDRNLDKPPAPTTIMTEVSIRNLKDNL